MNQKYNLLLLFIILTATSCKNNEAALSSVGTILVETATRGSYQYLIRIEEQTYFPENLPKRFQTTNNHEKQIYVQFELTGHHQEILIPAPNDIPVYGYTVPIIIIMSIDEK